MGMERADRATKKTKGTEAAVTSEIVAGPPIGAESPPTELAITLRVNGAEHQVRVLPGHTLLDVLRNKLKLRSVREGCGIGMCGACTVLVEGEPISSCLQLAWMAQSREITTVEGLSQDGQLHPVQQAFLDKTAFQCSYCTPGFVLATVSLLTSIEDPSTEQIKDYLAGNLCRCGSYVKIVDAVLAARDQGNPRKRHSSTASPVDERGVHL